jgi:hypothetical protein
VMVNLCSLSMYDFLDVLVYELASKATAIIFTT